jgi:spermidine/putrescine-binding protein
MRLRAALAIVALVFASVAGAWAEPRTIVVYTFLDGVAPAAL